jgi:hypothetical protein
MKWLVPGICLLALLGLGVLWLKLWIKERGNNDETDE